MRRGTRIAVLSLVSAVVAGLLTLTLWRDGMASDALAATVPAGSIPLAVIGDSGSHSYQDRVGLSNPSERGGALRSQTFQWTEVLARLRGQDIDLGPWVRWGSPGVVAQAREMLGLAGGRAPQKEDYLYNFANSGATCRNLMGTRFAQVPRLVALMNRDPKLWQRGVVVIRMGGNDWTAFLGSEANNPSDPALIANNAYCVNELQRSIALIHAAHPSTRIVVAGVAGEADDPMLLNQWQSAAEIANIRLSLNRFNDQIRQLTLGDPRLAFFDDNAWLTGIVGQRDANGKPDYKVVAIGPKLRVTNTVGDHPRNAVLADDHNGVALNAFYAQAIVAKLDAAFGLSVPPISDDELARFLEPLFAAAGESAK